MKRQFSFEFKDHPAGTAIQMVTETIEATLRVIPVAEICVAAGATPGALAVTVTTPNDKTTEALMALACPVPPWREDEI